MYGPLHWMFSCLSVSSDNQKRVQGLPNILREPEIAPGASRCMSLNWTLKALRVLIKLSFSALFLCLFLYYSNTGRKQTHKITPFLLAFGYAILYA